MLQSPHHNVRHVLHFGAGAGVVLPFLVFGHLGHISYDLSHLLTSIFQFITIDVES